MCYLLPFYWFSLLHWSLINVLSVIVGVFCFNLIYVWPRWFLLLLTLSLVAMSRDFSLLWCTVSLLTWLLLLWSSGSRYLGFRIAAHGLSSCGSWILLCRLRSCGTQAYLLQDMWDLPGPGIYTVSLALPCEFFTTEPPGKPCSPPPPPAPHPKKRTTNSPIFQYQLGLQEFNLFCTQTLHKSRFHRLRSLSHKTALTFNAS